MQLVKERPAGRVSRELRRNKGMRRYRLKAYDTVAHAQHSIGELMNFYNQDRRHTSLGRMTPDQVYYDLPSELPLAA